MGMTRIVPGIDDLLKGINENEKRNDITTIVNLVDMFFLLVRATGITFSSKNANKAFYFSCFIITGLSILMSYYSYQTFYDIYKTHLLITKVMYLLVSLTAIITLVTVLINRNIFIQTCNKIAEIDKILQVSSYKFWIYFSSGIMIILISIQIIYYTIQLLNDFNNFKILIVEYFSFTLGFVVHFYIVLLFTIYLMIIREKFKILNKMLKSYDNINIWNKKLDPKKILSKNTINNLDILTDIHYKLCECTENLNKTYTVPLFSCVHILYAEIIYIAYTYTFMYKSILEDYHFLLCCIFFTVNMFGLLICTYLVQIEAKNTFLLLGDVVICYWDGDMSLARNTLLLQGLHKKIAINICSIYSLNLSIILEEMSTITTIVLFLID